MPLNAVFLPLIAKLFPRAKILLALRDPRDVVLSCFRRRFAMNAGMYEFTTLETIGRLLRRGDVAGAALSRKSWRSTFWRRATKIWSTDFAGETGRLCDFLGLEFRDEMRGFAARARAQNIDTPSGAQVARGLSQAGLAQWRRYRPQLQPVLPMLAPFVARFGYPES